MIAINFQPFPNLETDRLFLRRVSSTDVEGMFALRSNPETMQYVPRPLATSKEDILVHIAMIDEKIESNIGINWAITMKGNPKLIGIIGHYKISIENQRAEIGYMLLPEFHGKGIITEAIKVVVKYGFEEMQLHSIEAIIDPRNYGSEKALQKSGFVKEAHLLENEFYDGEFLDTVIYSLLKRNYRH